ncbi:hypothetical protein TNCV_1366181 [Trichonephila clavipes]|nr:hypothetical protein TNCV_1366181 [Trichonephila clavipes]
MLERRIAARPRPPATLRVLEIALLEEWNSIPQSLIDNLIASMANRVKVTDSWPACHEFDPVLLNTRRVGGRCTLNLSRLKCLHVSVVWKLGEECQLRCRPHHFTMVQNYEVHRQMSSDV